MVLSTFAVSCAAPVWEIALDITFVETLFDFALALELICMRTSQAVPRLALWLLRTPYHENPMYIPVSKNIPISRAEV